MRKIALQTLFISLCFFVIGIAFAQESDSIPKRDWRSSWNDPDAELRPLQIIHGYFGVNKAKWSHPYIAFDHFGDRSIADGMEFLKNDCGLGGVVCNVSSYKYMQDPEEWSNFVEAVRQAKANGLRVWIYDEDRYPSLAAGGLVLKENPDLEAKELVWDPVKKDFVVRRAFEYTHASNNYAYIRRYPSLVNPEAGKAFIRLTHENYKKHLGPDLFDSVEAFFTDEPSTNVLITGLLSDKIREGVRTIDRIDPKKPMLPSIVWEDDFPAIYKKMYGEDLLAVRKSLFSGESKQDQKVRRQFWSMVAKRSIDAYYGQIRDWCKENHKLFSGHGLWEGALYGHVPLDGDKLAVLKTLDIPGMDFLSTNPASCFHGWKDALFPASASWLTGRRKVMTEISDIDTHFNGKPRASLKMMCAAAAWQSIFGITEFTLYYQITDRTPEVYRKYCEFVGRLNAIARDADPVCDAVLLYPVRDLQEEYLPQNERLELKRSSARMRKICQSFDALGKKMIENHSMFLLAEESDMEALLSGKIPHLAAPKTAVIPGGVDLSENLKKTLDLFKQQGGKVYFNEFEGRSPIFPADRSLICGKYRKGREQFYLILNTSERKEYFGHLKIDGDHADLLYPEDGRIIPAEIENHAVKFKIGPWETVIIAVR
ncbi:MAG: hypothetical protein Q4G69_09635 [Planctomycetia bacterium]|nr:hypothetical protein [Planctomycetia bacterium]